MTQSRSNTLLSSPGPIPTVNRIDFKKTPLEEYDGLYAVMIDNVLTVEECHELIGAAEEQGEWEKAMINVGGGRQRMQEDIRKCGRIMWDNQDLMNKLWARIEPLLPELQEIEDWKRLTQQKHFRIKFTRINERMRILKYGAGEYFKRHWDGCYTTPDLREKSYFTLHLYLNDAKHQPDGEKLEGGATTFWSWDGNERYDVHPKMGSVLIFQHNDLIHSGDDLLSGTKITLRSDLMYRDQELPFPDQEEEEEED